MQKILLIGAGRSSNTLIKYLIQQKSIPIHLTIADQDYALAQSKSNSEHCTPIHLDISNEELLKRLIAESDVVLSLLPPHLHHRVAKQAIQSRKHIITASYISPEVAQLHTSAVENEVLVMGELGLDPGLDHMSAMSEINRLHSEGQITGFKSATGGIVAPESRDNPWGYKITWNPMNVVRAGSSGATFLSDGQTINYQYQEIFNQIEKWSFPDLGNFEVYANRDSMKYKDLYGLEGIQTLYRGTVRYSGFCESWDILRKLGLTDDQEVLPDYMTYHSWMFRKFPDCSTLEGLLEKLDQNTPDNYDRIQSLDMDRQEYIDGIPLKNSAEVLKAVLMDKWKMHDTDKDMILMQHQFSYEKDGRELVKKLSLQHIGNDAEDTAMSQLVGLPMGIFAIKILEGITIPKGVHIPIMPAVYEPILKELYAMGIGFQEEIVG